mmetsp:Transcript_87647/g.256232  ORF Transcript_87647/g.256232 Transcript_87647/m.256232 type:complete len:322 (+) Transcript_87647:46-1011(+)
MCPCAAMMVSRRWALLLLAVFAQASEPKGREIDADSDQSASLHIDPVSASFYLGIDRKVQPLGLRHSSSKKRAALAAKVVACGWVCDFVAGHLLLRELSSSKAPTLSAMQSCQGKKARQQPVSVPRTWLGSALLALMAAAAALGSCKARRHPGRRLQTLSGCSVNLPRRCSTVSELDGSTSAGSTPTRFLFIDSSETDSPKRTKLGGAAANESVRRLLGASEGGMCRAQTEPCGEDELDGSQGTLEIEGPRMLRQQSTPGQKKCRINANGVISRAEYGNGRFVRTRKHDFERRIEFHRMASENSEEVDVNEYSTSMEVAWN